MHGAKHTYTYIFISCFALSLVERVILLERS